MRKRTNAGRQTRTGALSEATEEMWPEREAAHSGRVRRWHQRFSKRIAPSQYAVNLPLRSHLLSYAQNRAIAKGVLSRANDSY